MDTVFRNNGLYVLLSLFALFVAAFICSINIFITSILFKRSARELLHINMLIKIIHVPAYILIFFIGLFSLITIFTAGITVALIILDGLTILLTGLIGLAGIIRAFVENKLPKKTAIIHAVLQFVFCADVISSIVIYKKIKNAV